MAPTTDEEFNFICPHSDRCSGCSEIGVPYRDQRRAKIADLKSQLQLVLSEFSKDDVCPDIEFTSCGPGGLRDRVDYTISNDQQSYSLGLYSHHTGAIVDLPDCGQLSPALNLWLKDFRSIHWPIKRGSIRLRVGPKGQRGAWLDFANQDIKTLLEEGAILKRLQEMAFVEIGQKHKALEQSPQAVRQLKLGEPQFHEWSSTFLSRNSGSTPLLSTVAAFTQPGEVANRVLISSLLKMIEIGSSETITEFGSGVGNLTLPLAARGNKLKAYELDSIASEALKQNAQRNGLEDRVEIKTGNFQQGRGVQRDIFEGSESILVDPPRSGLKSFLDPLAEMDQQAKPRHFFYVSCYPESFALDVARLYRLGYRLQALEIVDQFPQTQHYEIVSHLKLES